MSVRRFAVAMQMHAPAERVWRRIASYEHWADWGTSIRSVDTDRTIVQPGDEGRVETILGLGFPFRITDVANERSWDWTVAGVPATGHEVISNGTDRCTVRFTAPWWSGPYALVLLLSLRKLKRQVEESVDAN